MIAQNNAIRDLLGVTAWHKAGYTGKRVKAITYERTAITPLLEGHVTTLWEDQFPVTYNDHATQTALAFLEIAPDAHIYQVEDNHIGRMRVYSGFLTETLIPWLLENKPCVGYRSLSDPEWGFDEEYAGTAGFLSLFNAAGNNGTESYAARIQDKCWFGVGAAQYLNGALIPEGYSSVSEYVDFCATLVYLPTPGGWFYQFNGTSCATPVQGGMAAIVNDMFIDKTGKPLSSEAMYRFLKDNTVDMLTTGHDTKTGWGYVKLPPPESVDVWRYQTKEDTLVIIEEQYIWNGELCPRDPHTTHYLVEHHAAGNGSAQYIHQLHVAKGWRGIAYNYYIRKDGSIYRGRPEDTYGGHTADHHGDSLGICYEGNFEIEEMTAAQREAGKCLTAYIAARYPGIMICRHSALNATACPGKNFPFAEITQEEIEMRYNTIAEIPDWGKPTIQKLIDKGALKGTDEGLNISEDMLRMFVINDRLGLYE